MFYIDDNECLTNKGGCAQICNNTVGSYICDCFSGYELDDNGHGCLGWLFCINRKIMPIIGVLFFLLVLIDFKDIDECLEEMNFCHHLCININGSYQCGCNTGYELVDDFHCESK